MLQDASSGSENTPPDPIPDQTIPAEPSLIGTGSIASIILAVAAVACAVWIIRRRLYDPVRPGPSTEWPLGRIADWPALLLGGMVVWIAQAAGASSAAMLFTLTDADRSTLRGSALISLGGYLAAMVGVAFVFFTLPNMARIIRLIPLTQRPRKPLLNESSNEEADGFPRIALRAAAAFALIFPIVMTIGWCAAIIARWITGEPPDAIAHQTLRLLTDHTAAEGSLWWWLTVGCVLIGAPIAEEIVYRGFIQSAIRRAVLWSAPRLPPRSYRGGCHESASDGGGVPRRAAWASILGTSIIFATMHLGAVEPHALLTLFSLSVCFGVACERSGSLIAPILMHVCFNAANLALSLVA